MSCQGMVAKRDQRIEKLEAQRTELEQQLAQAREENARLRGALIASGMHENLVDAIQGTDG